MTPRYWVIPLIFLYLLLGWQYATRTPAWQVPDEPAHYNYIRQLAENRRLPIIEMGDWDSAYQNLLVSSGFDPQHTADLDRIQYEDHQPPLYYLLAAPLYSLTDGNLTTLRLFSVLLGAGAVLGAFFAGLRLFGQQPWVAVGAAGFVAFVPQNLAMLGGVNNDALSGSIAGLSLWAVVVYLHTGNRPQHAAGLGILVGLAFLTKSTIYFLAGVAGLAILLRGWRAGWSRYRLAQAIAAFLLPALLLGGLWWGRSVQVYGGTDFLGLQRHDEVAAGQLQTQDYIQRDLDGDSGLYRKNLAYTTFHSFWGQFGWMALPMPPRIYRILLAICAGLLLGFGVYLGREWRVLTPPQRDSLVLFGVVVALTAAAYGLYNRQFVQFQGRYLFPALLPLGMVASLGVWGWAGIFAQRLPLLRWVVVLAVLLLALLAWYALHRYIVPTFPVWD